MFQFSLVEHEWGSGRTPPDVPLSKLIFADPPYNFAVKYEDDPTADNVSPQEYGVWTAQSICELSRCLAPGGTLWWMVPECHADMVGPLLTSDVGPRVHRIIFEESFAQYQQRSLTQDYRMIFCHRKPGATITFNADAIREESVRQQMGDTRADPRGRVPGQVWKMRRLQGTSKDRVDWHPAQLPPELLRRIVKGWSNPGDVVVDAFAGSGNMGVVCRQEHRVFIGVERSATYLEKIQNRITANMEVRSA